MNSECLERNFIAYLLILLSVSASFCQEAGKLNVNSSPGESNLVKVQFHETDSVIVNPGQGWMSSRFPSSIKYFRVAWADLEPEHGKYNWSIIDTAITSAKQKGMKISFRIFTCNPHSKGYYSTPKWLFDEGCKSHEYIVPGTDPYAGGARFPRNEPDYSDSLFLLRHREFIRALGHRYDESSDIDFLDIGSYGYWGEWHTPNSVPVSVRERIVDMYSDAFKKTPLVFMTDDAEVLAYALDKRIGLRRDGVGSTSHEQNWIGSYKYARIKGMADAWKSAPVVFEWYGDYNYIISRGWSFDAAVNFILRNHVTAINDNIGQLPVDKMSQIKKLLKLAGARFVLNEMTHEKTVKRGSSLIINMKWTNSGVGKVYKPYVLRFFFLDDRNRVVFTYDAKTDPLLWLPGAFDVKESLMIPHSLKKGSYRLALAILNKNNIESVFHLAIDVAETNRMYLVSKLNVD